MKRKPEPIGLKLGGALGYEHLYMMENSIERTSKMKYPVLSRHVTKSQHEAALRTPISRVNRMMLPPRCPKRTGPKRTESVELLLLPFYQACLPRARRRLL